MRRRMHLLTLSGLHTDGNQGVRGVDENVNDIDGLPSRYEVLLWHYGRQKQENGERNDFENLDGGENKHEDAFAYSSGLHTDGNQGVRGVDENKEKYGSVPIRVTTTYFYFDTTILKLFTKFMTGGSVNHLLDKSTDIMQYINGFRFLYNTPWTEEDAFAYSSGLHTDGNQGVRGVDENVNDVTLNDGVGGGYSSKEVVGGDVGDGVGGGVGVSEGNDSQSDIVFVSVSESVITTITQKYYNNKKGENEKVPDVNVNTQDLVDDVF
ncbi:hypothetical protein RND71_031914 [Anisodus tanguticus]|uniref:Uncharacterized protein n=1 Tax=Anisodus tanguticus TaxID=243964 RepID=A0AAE1RD98_9SOLA|nr:hypothetical protein RND71_031914 [Anisodus tanguticus]